MNTLIRIHGKHLTGPWHSAHQRVWFIHNASLIHATIADIQPGDLAGVHHSRESLDDGSTIYQLSPVTKVEYQTP